MWSVSGYASAHYSGISFGIIVFFGIIGALIKKNNSRIMGVKFEKGASPIKVQSLNERPCADEPGYNGRARSHGHIGQCRRQPVVV